MPEENSVTVDHLKAVVAKYWGYNDFRPLQKEAMQAVLDGRDSLVVLPTGGGKSLCYQAPAVARGGTTVVVSPLISLMKDQVDGLRSNGIPAAQLDSSLSSVERHAYQMDIMQDTVRLVFVSPERMVTNEFGNLLRRIDVRTFAIDEAHCISHWGHDFRPEYRQMRRIKEWFPKASVHCYTATATEKVREDICKQMALDNPHVLVGNFDRPNLNYRVLPRRDLATQVVEILNEHKGDPGIIYCLRRADVDDLTAALNNQGFACLPYHAGKSPEERSSVQEAFASEKCNLIVATVAFGMGIDRSNIRFVLHTGMPKSIEHYQQETGRGGRDGLEAECTLLYSGEDNRFWDYILTKSAGEKNVDPSFLPNALEHLSDINRFCNTQSCRHRALVQYFGQEYDGENCRACDVCLRDTKKVKDGQTIARKILSCVARVEQRFGVNHVISVLRGENLEKIRKMQHDKLSTYGLLEGHPKYELRDFIYQLIGQDVLLQNDIEMTNGRRIPVLALNEASWQVMQNERQVALLEPAYQKEDDRRSRSKAEQASWEGVDRDLFEALRKIRRDLAANQGVPPYVVFGDKTLRDMAAVRPTSLQKMRLLYGVGEKKLADYGSAFLDEINSYCQDNELAQDVPPPKTPPIPVEPPKPNTSSSYALAASLFENGATVEEVVEKTARARSTVLGYLCDYVTQKKPDSIEPWVSAEVVKRVRQAAQQVGTDRLKPIFIALGEKVSYEEIRMVLAHIAGK